MHSLSNPDVSVLVVGYNSADGLEKCLSAIECAIAGLSAEVLFVNNGSDNSEDIVRVNFPSVQVLKSRGNVGFAGANNYLAQNAVGRFLLLVNPDTEIDTCAVALLLDGAKTEPHCGIAGGTTIFAKTPDHKMPTLKLPTTSRLLREVFVRQQPGSQSKSAPHPAEATSGGFMMIKRALWKHLGGMDERFFLYGEDLDLCKRASEAGVRIVEFPEAKIRHDVGSGSFYSSTRQLYQAKGNATFQWKHSSIPRATLNIGLIWLRFAARVLGAGLFALTSERHRLVFKALAPLALMPWRWVSGYQMHPKN